MSTENLNEQIARATENLRLAKIDYAQLAAKLAGDPGNRDLNIQFEQLEGELAGYRRTLVMLTAAREEAARNQTKEAKAAKFKHLTQMLDRVEKSSTTTEEIVAKVKTNFEGLALLLAQLQHVIESRSSDAHAIVAGTRGKHEHRDTESNITRLAKFQQGEIVESLARLVYDSGLANTAVDLAPYTTVTQPNKISATHTLGEAVERANSKLIAALDGRLAQAKKELGVE